MKYKRTIPVETYVTVDIDLEDIDTDDLVEELERRGQVVKDEDFDQLTRIYELRRTGRLFDTELDNYIYDVLGKIV